MRGDEGIEGSVVPPVVERLHPFQREAFNFMLETEQTLLCLSMGLGKTISVIAVCEKLLHRQVDLVLVVTLASLKYQWEHEIRKWAPDADVIVADGSPTKRKSLYKQWQESGEYLICNYEQIVNDWDFFNHANVHVLVVDECQAVKNHKAERTKKLKLIQPRWRYGLTGQPVENKAEEVFSIMEMIDADLLGSFYRFDKAFVVRNHWGGVERYRNMHVLHERLKKRMYRKRADDPDVLAELPDVLPPIVYTHSLGRANRGLFDRVVRDVVNMIEENQTYTTFSVEEAYGREDSDDKQGAGKVMARVTALRQLVDDPRLLRVSAEKFALGEGDGSSYAHELLEEGLLEDLKPSPKYKAAIEHLEEIVEAGDKVVLFSVYKDSLHWMQKDLAAKGVGAVVFTGDLTSKERERVRQQFEEDPEVRVFLSSDAGGTGLDLPGARVLVNYSLPWSAGKIAQRNARIRRLSSKHASVATVYHLTERTMDERIYDLLQKKQEVADAIVDGRSVKGVVDMDLGSLRDFLTEKK